MALQEKQAALLALQLPILIHFLVDSSTTSSPDTASAHKVALHDAALSRLTRLGQLHPKEFKRLLESNIDLAERVKAAVVANSNRQRARQLAAVARVAAPVQPSITLKMDFSNFK